MLFNQPIYTTQRRGTTTRFLSPKSGGGPTTGGMPIQNDKTIIGDKIFSRANARKFFEFQNIDAVNDMRLAFGQPATLDTGILVGPFGSVRWEIEVPSEEAHVFCAAADAKFSFQERLVA